VTATVNEEPATYDVPPLHRFTRKDYHAMADAGILTERDRVELINGRIVAMMPIGPWHSASSSKLNYVLNRLYDGRGIVSMGNPVGLGDDSEPQPDVTVLRWRDDFYSAAHPEAKDVLLLIEVADSSRAYDLGTKLDLYAKQGVEEVWVVDRQQECVHVFRHPIDGAYRESRDYARAEALPLPDCGEETLKVTETGV
jgi:Uma2 family endonuclease